MEIQCSNCPPALKVGEREKAAVRKVLEKMAEVYGLEAAEVSVTFTDNASIRALNAKYLSLIHI